jgi:hypothetical protein
MNLVFVFYPDQVPSAAMSGRLIVHVSSGVAADGAGVAKSAFGLATKLRTAGLPFSFGGVIRFSCNAGVEPQSLTSVARELRAAGWVQTKYEASSPMAGAVFAGPAATAALRSIGARAMTMDASVFSNGASPGPQDPGLFAHERVHQL